MTGYDSKRAAAADKLQEPAQDESDMLTIAYLDGYEKGKREALAQPAQEPDYWLGYGLQAHTEKPFENATALYIVPPKRPWVGLTDEDKYEFAAAQHSWEDLCLAVEAKLKKKNV